MRILTTLFLAVCCHAATCTSQGSTPQPSNSSGTWDCGHVPLSSDDVIIATPVQLTGDLLGNTIKYHGATARLGTDGAAPHLVKSFSSGVSQSLELGCSTTTSACITPFILDTCTNSSAGNEVTFAAVGLANIQFVFTHLVDAVPGGADIQVQVCHFISQSGAGGFMAHEGLFGSLDTSHWSISTGHLIGTGVQVDVFSLGHLAVNNVSWDAGAERFLFISGGTEPTTCTLTNLTITGNTGAIGVSMFQDISPGPAGCVVSGYAFETAVRNYGASTVATVTDSILKSTIGTALDTQTGIDGAATIFHNAVDGFAQDIETRTGTTSSFNFLVQNNAISGGQGAIFTDGDACGYVSHHDILTVDDDPFLGDSIISLGLNAMTPSCGVYSNETVYQGILHPLGGVETIALGEDDAGPMSNTAFFNSIVVSGNTGFRNRSMNNVFLTNGTGGVGIYNNDVFNPAAADSGYTNPYPLSHFDNGVTPHPNAIYGDITQQDPHFLNITRRFPQCDALLGGAGTLANMFQVVMFNRWTGAAPIYTPGAVVDCLRQGWSPTNSALFTSSSTGSFIGAMPPAPAGVRHRLVTSP